MCAHTCAQVSIVPREDGRGVSLGRTGITKLPNTLNHEDVLLDSICMFVAGVTAEQVGLHRHALVPTNLTQTMALVLATSSGRVQADDSVVSL
jgi:hypothetical protein